MRRATFLVGAALVVLGALSLLQVGLNALGVHFRVGWVFWPLLLIGVGAWIIAAAQRGSSTAAREDASVPLDGASSAEVTVRHGAGRLSITAGSPGADLLTGSFGGGLDARRRLEGGLLRVNVRPRVRDPITWITGPWRHGWSGMLDWDVALNPSVPISLLLETGASESRVALGGLAVRELSLRTGASSTTVDLPEAAGFTRVKVESGAAAVRLRVPRGVAASITVRSAVAGVTVDAARFPGGSGRWVSPDYASAANKAEIVVDMGAGSIDIR